MVRFATALLAVPAVTSLVAPSQQRLSHIKRAGSVYTGEEEGGGLKFIELKHESGSSAKVYPFGADVCSFKDASGTEWIAVRPDAKLDGSKPISGGLSHCFPQFGPGAIQQHGFARNVFWKVAGWDDAGSSVTLVLEPTEYTKGMWDEPFKAEFKVSLNENSLDTKMTVTNTGADGAFDFQAALHSYFTCSSIDDLKIAGSFAGKSYLDKAVDPAATKTEDRAEITIGEPYDRVYAGVADPVLVDAGKGAKLNVVNKAGWKDTVLWNPYGDQGMGYRTFVCVESVAYDPVTLAPGAEWVGEMSLVPEPL